MPLEKGSLVLLDYTAKVKDTNEVFETTREEEAKKADLYDPTRKYQPRLVSVGDGWVLKGLDEALAGASVGDKLNVEVPPEKAFGKRDDSKVRIIPQRKLGDKADEVGVGDTIEVDDRPGIVRYVGSGRIQVDFNHRFAGRTLLYDVNILKKLETDSDKVAGLLKRWLPLDDDKLKFNLNGAELEVSMPEETYQIEGIQAIKSGIARDIFKMVATVKDVKFVEAYHAPEQQQPAKAEQEEKSNTASSATTAAAETRQEAPAAAK